MVTSAMIQVSGRPILIGKLTPASLLQPLAQARPDIPFSEERLQSLIHEHPSVLPVQEIEPGFGRLISICRELNTRHGPIDNLLMTPEGNIVLVEVKLWQNPESRRKVVAQALDYAACLFEMNYSDLEAAVLKADIGTRPKPVRLFDLIRGERPTMRRPSSTL